MNTLVDMDSNRNPGFTAFSVEAMVVFRLYDSSPLDAGNNSTPVKMELILDPGLWL